MRGVALCLAITGVFLLFGVMIFSPAMEVNSLENVQINDKVIVEGLVESERITSGINIMKINGMEVVCDCIKSYKGRNLRAYGLVGEFNNKKQVRIMRLELN